MGQAVGKDVYPKGNCLLSSKEIKELHHQILSEYPFLSNVYESMLVADNTKPDCPIVYANDQFERMTLYPKEDVLGRNCRFLQGKYTDRNVVAKIRNAVDKGLEMDVLILNYRKDGVAFWNSFMMLPVHHKGNKNGRVTHFIAIQKDVTVLKDVGENPERWSPPEVAMWLERYGFGEYAVSFVDKGIDGLKFLELSPNDLQALGLLSAAQKRLSKLIEKLREPIVGNSTVLRSLSAAEELPNAKDIGADVSQVSEEGGNLGRLNRSASASSRVIFPAKDTVLAEAQPLEAKSYWNRHEPASEKMACKFYIEGKPPSVLLIERGIRLDALRDMIEKSFGHHRITYKEDDYACDIEEDADLQAIIKSLAGERTLVLHLEHIEDATFEALRTDSTYYLKYIPMAVVICDALTHILYLNKSAKLLFGVEHAKLVRNKPLNNILYTPIPDLKFVMLQQMTQGATEVEYKVLNTVKKARLHVAKTDVGTYVLSFML
eukprot:CAMPEP_0168554104 /NCGR_PEP_ID=MMETSP0413-20121227/7602_1 /TAXON_ID=136452 /ORGANISM="Filamoeba nolandi, Strain NC-AS-23-1" /LENGTH=489 /DNA_ID=CAMNT_0008584823 /DNA_START=81 /DNA_END=1550 /DNA_ORIENTATION=+